MIDDGTPPRALLVEIARRTVADGGTTPATSEDRLAGVHRSSDDTSAAHLRDQRNRVLLHTNSEEPRSIPGSGAAAAEAATGYSPLEMDLDTGTRGGRGRYANAFVTALTGAEAALTRR